MADQRYQIPAQMVQSFKDEKRDENNSWLSHAQNSNSLTDAIKRAALQLNALEKKHPHQRRRTKEQLLQFELALQKRKSEIADSTSFAGVIDLVDAVGKDIFGIGPLTCYDTAKAIGHYLGLSPSRVYLYAGALRGAKILMQGKVNGRSISKEQLVADYPELAALTPSEIEAFLCIYVKPKKDARSKSRC